MGILLKEGPTPTPLMWVLVVLVYGGLGYMLVHFLVKYW